MNKKVTGFSALILAVVMMFLFCSCGIDTEEEVVKRASAIPQSKEEIFNFLIEEGIKLLQNSIDIKTEKLENYIDKIKAIVLIEIKIVNKYEDFITILLSQFYGKEARNQMCQKYVYEYIEKIEKVMSEEDKE